MIMYATVDLSYNWLNENRIRDIIHAFLRLDAERVVCETLALVHILRLLLIYF